MFTQNGAWDIIFAYRAVKEPGERDYGAFFIFRHRFFQPASPAGEPMITLICVGSLKEGFFREAVGEYEKRLLGYTKMAILSVKDEREPDRASPKEQNRVREAEGNRMLTLLEALLPHYE